MKRLTTQEFIERLNIANPNVEVIGEYLNQRTKIHVTCKECRHEWLGNPSDLLSGHGCPKCRYINNSKRTRMSHEIFIERLGQINPHIIVLDQYVTSQEALAVKCELCQYTWKVKPNTLLCAKRATESGKQSKPTIPKHLIKTQLQRVARNILIQ